MISKNLKIYFLVAIFGAIVVALIGYVYTEKDLPPYPDKIVSPNGVLLSGKEQIMAGQQVWQKNIISDQLNITGFHIGITGQVKLSGNK